MFRRHLVDWGLLTLSFIILACVLLMWLAGQTSSLIFNSITVIISLGVLADCIIPQIALTWLIIFLTTIGSASLLLGYVVMPTFQKLLLLSTFPIIASLTALAKQIIGAWGWIDRNRTDINNYIAHYNPVVKLKSKYDATHLYHKEVRFIINEEKAKLRIDLNMIQWVHSKQFRQFHEEEYKETLHSISKILKDLRFPSEQIYYLGNETFLIISYALDQETLTYKNAQTQASLKKLSSFQALPQYKWASLHINRKNVYDYMELNDALRYLTREMETDLVIEYLKGVESCD